MKLVETREIPLGEIIIGERISAVDEGWVQAIADSFRQRGQGEAIQLARLPDGALSLMAGRHRLAAAGLVEWPTIRAAIFAPETENIAAEMRLHEVDENLFRRDLTALERAGHLAERKAAYEALWPQARHGGDRKSDQVANLATWRFTAATAEKIGISERSIQRAVAIWHGLSPDLRQRLAGTALADNGKQLELLADLPEPKQVRVVTVMLAEGGPRDVETAQAIVDGDHVVVGDNPTDKAFKRFIDLWARASTTARRLIVEHLVGLGEAQAPASKTGKGKRP